ncbi:MAG TPA: phage tail protein, partial [Methanothrix sp.]
KDSRHYTWDGIINDARPGLARGWLFGKMKVGGQIVSEKTWFDANNNEYLDELICPCKGPITRFYDVRINDTEYLYYDNCQIALRPGDDEQTMIDMFNKIYTQYRSGAKIPYDSSSNNPSSALQWTSKADITGCRFVITAPRGLYELVNGTPQARSVVYRIQYKKESESSWSFVMGDSTTWGSERAFIHRASGIFSGTSNPYTLTDAGSGGGANAGFSSRISAGANFELIVDGTTYYCTQTGTLNDTTIQFNAYTNSARTIAKTGAFSSGAYVIQHGDITYSVSGFSGRIYTGFDTDTNCTAIKFRLNSYSTIDGSTTFTFSRFRVYYRKMGATSWTLHNTYEVGACYYGYYADASWDIVISNLEEAQYQVRIDWANDCCTNPYGTHNVNALSIDELYFSTQSEDHTISGDSSNPTTSVTKTVEVTGLDEDTYQFRVWRTTQDYSTIYWCDDIYLHSYSEIIDAQCAYPGNALIGVRAMATDRLSGSRPKITAIGIGYPLTVPDEDNRYDTYIYQDEGLVTGTGNVVNNTNVDGMRKLLVPVTLPDPGTEWGEYYWLVRKDTDGYADTDHLLTKFTIRVHTWEVLSGYTRLYVMSTESIPAGTQVMIFHEDYGGYDRLAWAVAKMLIDGSRGRITASQIDWDSFKEFDEWCESIVDGERRHKFDALIDFSTDLWSIATRAALQGRGMLLPSGRQYRIVIDKAVEAPVCVFGEGNTRNAKILPIPRQDRANILVTSFLDENANYEEKTISEEDVQSGEYPIAKNLPVLVGVTRETEARRYLRYLLRQNRYIDHMIQFEAGFDSIAIQVGDVFAFQSQANDFAFSGKITGENGSNLILDCTFTPEPSETYKLYVWGQDAQVYTWSGTLSGTDINEVPWPTGFDLAGPYEADYILTRVSDERTLYRCIGIKRSGDTLFATITGIQYAPEVYEDD